MSNLFGILQQYAGGGSQTAANAEQDFQHVAQNAPQEHVAGALTDLFRGGGESSFPQMIGNLFTRSNGQQQAGILNHLIEAAGPQATSGILGSILGSQSGSPGRLNEQQASQIPPEAVQQMAAQAQQSNPSIVEQAGNFYSQHPTLVQALGTGALAMVMSHMSRRAT